jgi:hypothetical protein
LARVVPAAPATGWRTVLASGETTNDPGHTKTDRSNGQQRDEWSLSDLMSDGLGGSFIVALGLRIPVAHLADILLTLIVSLTGDIRGTACKISGSILCLINQAFGRAPASLSASLGSRSITSRSGWSIGLHVSSLTGSHSLFLVHDHSPVEMTL